MIFLIYYFLGWVVGIIVILLDNGPKDIQHISQILLLYQLVVTVGLMGILSAYGHIFMSDKVAKQIGWKTGSMFQIELGFCCLGMGLMGILSFWFRDGFWFASIVFTSTFLLGAAYVHIKEMKMQNNFNPGNAISTIPDILIPVTLIVLWFLQIKI